MRRAYYTDQDVVIYHGDCMEILPGLGIEAGLILTDPPYGTETHSNARSLAKESAETEGVRRIVGSDADRIDFACVTVDDLRSMLWLLAPLTARWLVCFAQWQHAAALDTKPPGGLDMVRVGAWIKTNPCPQISGDRPAHGWETICYMHRSGIRKRWNGGGHHGNHCGPKPTRPVHPTEKPLDLLGTIVQRFSDPGDLILDPFAGSGTTGLAAVAHGRQALLVELDERYCEIAARRLSQGRLL